MVANRNGFTPEFGRRKTQRSDSLRTRGEILAAYLRAGSPRILLVTAMLLVVARIMVGQWGWADVVVSGVTLALTGLVEWVIHLFLLHAPEDSFRMRKLKTGTGHRNHHLDPTNMQWLLLNPIDATIFVVMFGAFTAAWSMPLLWLMGLKVLPGFLTAYAAAAISLSHYEWVHLLVHTRYRPTSRYYGRLTRNHRLHHYRNEKYWLGVTMNSGDRLLGTLPEKSEVPLSPTARTLGQR